MGPGWIGFLFFVSSFKNDVLSHNKSLVGLKRCGTPVASFSVRDSNGFYLTKVSTIDKHIVFVSRAWSGIARLDFFREGVTF